MTDATPSATTRVSSAGAWWGLLVAVWAALIAAWHVAWLAAVAATPVFVDGFADRAEEQSGPAGLPEPFARLVELAFEFVRTLRPYARIADASGALLGLLLFCSAFAFLRGSDAGRRGVRTLLAVKAAHTVGAAAWLVVLFVATLDAWRGRFAAAVAEIARDAPHDFGGGSVGAGVAAWMRTAPILFAGVVATSLTATAVLFWIAGRPSSRAWCAARNSMRTVDSPAARR